MESRSSSRCWRCGMVLAGDDETYEVLTAHGGSVPSTPHSHGMVMPRRTHVVKFLQQATQTGSVALCLLTSGLHAGEYQPTYAGGQTQRIVEPGANAASQYSDYRVANLPVRTAQPAATPPQMTVAPAGQQSMMMAQPIAIPNNLPPGTQFILVPVQANGSASGMMIPPGMMAVPQQNLPAQSNAAVGLPADVARSPSPRPAPAATLRPEQLTGLNQQVNQVGAQAWQLAERNALFAARQKFEEALQLAAHGIDSQAGGNRNGRALKDAFTAFKEAEDFAARPDDLLAERDVTRLTELHQTPVLKDGLAGMPNVMALQAYFRYGRQHLVEAVRPLPAAADALHGLGKVHTFLAKEEGSSNELHIARAIAYQQAALDINPRQARAAHELGVLLATHGQWQDAKQALLQSLRTQQRAETWQNLAIVHQRLGEIDLARRADFERARLTGPAEPAANAVAGSVQWIDPSQFARQSQPNNLPQNMPPMNVPRSAPVANAKTPAPPGYYPR